MTRSATSIAKRRPGRPVEFDRATALNAAMLHFWQFGYEGSSLDALTKAMGISKPTLYAAFGDKATLFREAVAAYSSLRASKYTAALALPHVREVADAWLRLTGGVNRPPGSPAGCLIVQGASRGDEETTLLSEELAQIRLQGAGLLRKRLQRAKRDGDLPSFINPDDLAEFLASLSTGMAIQSANGASPEKLNQVVDLLMALWPKSIS